MHINLPARIIEFCKLIGINPEATDPAEMLGAELWAALIANPDDAAIKNEAMQKVYGRVLSPEYSKSLVQFAKFYGFSDETPPLLIEMKLETLALELALLLKEVSQGTHEAGSIRDIVKLVVEGKRAQPS